MEKFEDYRRNLAGEIKESPKEERKDILDSEKNNPEYKKARELKEAKRGSFELSHTESLDDPEDPISVSKWIKVEIEDFAERRSGYGAGAMFEELAEEIHKYLCRRLNVEYKKPKSIEISDSFQKTTHRDDDDYEGQMKGAFSLMGEKILDYSAFGDGYGFSVDEWYDSELRVASKNLIDYIKDQG